MRKREIISGIRRVQREDALIEATLLRRGQRASQVKNRRRTERTQRLLRLGTNAWVAGLLEIDTDVLEGALRRARPLAEDPAHRRSWRKAGEVASIDWEEGGEKCARGVSLESTVKGGAATDRKARNRRLIILGAIIEKVDWGEEDPTVLLGVLLVIKAGLAYPTAVARWKASGLVAVPESENPSPGSDSQTILVGSRKGPPHIAKGSAAPGEHRPSASQKSSKRQVTNGAAATTSGSRSVDEGMRNEKIQPEK
jgi:hypothetical protein